MSADSDAYEVVKQLPGLTLGEQQYLLTVSRGEGFYGRGWSVPPVPGSEAEKETQALGLTGTEGAGSNNWGAIQGSGSAGSFPHLDHHADGRPYKGAFKRYTFASEGAADVARNLLKPNVKAAIAGGDLHGAVYAQHANRYFELAPDKYLVAVKRNYDILTQNLKWPELLKIPVGIIAKAPLASGSPPLPSAGASSTLLFTLRFGSVGEKVGEWQRLLNKLGYQLTVDDDFGLETYRSTRLFQARNKLTIDGAVGPETWKAANGQV